MLALVMSIHAQGLALNLAMKDGTVHSFLLSEKPVITVSGGLLVLTASDASVSYTLTDVKQYTFGSAVTGIKEIDARKSVKRNGDMLVFYGLKGAKVYVCNINGIKEEAEVSVNGENTEVSLSHLSSGIHIIKANGITVKITKK